MTFVSIITPAYRAEATICRAVRSMMAQTHGEWEMLVVADDEEDYQALLKRQGLVDSRLRFASTGALGKGPGAARNAGLDLARYDVVANLDADDAYSEDFLRNILPAVAAHGACTSRTRVLEAATGQEMPNAHCLRLDQPFTISEMMRHCPTFAPIVFNRRWRDVRWPELHYGEDLLLWLLLLDELPAIYYVAEARYDYYFRKGSLSRPDEPTTHGLCERRNRMINWLKKGNAIGRNKTNRDVLIGWLESCNAMEESFGYQLVDVDVYLREVSRRFDMVFSAFAAKYDIAFS